MSSTRQRMLVPTVNRPATREVEDFASRHPELLINQWISAIDKIATKPKADKNATKAKPTAEQRALRHALGEAALATMKNQFVLTFTDELERFWWTKVHPYHPNQDEQPNSKRKPPKPQGRSYEKFAGTVAPDKIDANAVAKAIYQHLHVSELSKRPKKLGLIAARANCIARNVHGAKTTEAVGWNDDDWNVYTKTGDVARQIRQKADTETRISRTLPSTELFGHYAKVFTGADGKAMGIAYAAAQHEGLFALHRDIKALYKALMDRKHGVKAAHLPADKTTLRKLLGYKKNNSDLSNLVRLGKVIHYEAAGDTIDTPHTVVSNWPTDIQSSRYWCSEGQTEIKRNEALVRVWRGIVALAARTLTDWADPDSRISEDIFSKITDAENQFIPEKFESKIQLLFGARSALFTFGAVVTQKSFQRLMLESWAALRHGSFHFKGRAGFFAAVEKGLEKGSTPTPEIETALTKLWQEDSAERISRLKATMVGAHFQTAFTQTQLQEIFSAVEAPPHRTTPQPRFRRILKCAEDSWRKGDVKLRLPAPGNRAALEQPAQLCHYTALKLLYERSFPAWMAKQPTDRLNGWIAAANARATKDAKSINKDEYAKARAEAAGGLAAGETFADFTDRIAALTASKMRVQRDYQPDAQQAKKNSEFLNKLLLDVVAQAFEGCLTDSGFEWLLAFDSAKALSDRNQSSIETLSTTASIQVAPETWAQRLYAMLHMVPVDDISKLLHQLRKWTVLEAKSGSTSTATAPQVVQIEAALDLYLDMHDAKFEGGNAMPVNAPFRTLYEQLEDFDTLFQNATDPRQDLYMPVRGLREMLRFGNFKPLMPVFQQHKIPHADVEALNRSMAETETGSSPIANAQALREELHESWAKDQKNFKRMECYKLLVPLVSHYKHLASAVRLTDHVRLHRLMMQILARLADYAGLRERDLYFVTLALIHQQELTPSDCFTATEKLASGQIVAALGKLNEAGKVIGADIEKYFCLCATKNIRNDLQHFNMLRQNTRLNLTHWINQTRTLMAYDRKLKNAVSLSAKALLLREDIDITWEMQDHQLTPPHIASKSITYMGGDGPTEVLHSDLFTAMVAHSLGGQISPKTPNSKPNQSGQERKNHDSKDQNSQNRAKILRQNADSACKMRCLRASRMHTAPK